MFDLSLAEMAVIVVLAIMVIGPKDLPVLLRTLGGWWRNIRNVAGEFREGLEAAAGMDEFHKASGEIEEDISYIRDESGKLQRVYDISEFLEDENDAPVKQERPHE